MAEDREELKYPDSSERALDGLVDCTPPLTYGGEELPRLPVLYVTDGPNRVTYSCRPSR